MPPFTSEPIAKIYQWTIPASQLWITTTMHYKVKQPFPLNSIPINSFVSPTPQKKLK